MNTQQLTFRQVSTRQSVTRTDKAANRAQRPYPVAQFLERHSEIWTVLIMLGILGYVADQTAVFASGMLHTVVANALTMYH